MRRRIVAVLAVIILGGGGFWWWYASRPTEPDEVVLYGNVEFRQVEVAFTDSGRLAELLVEEGDTVVAGEVIARLDTGRVLPQVEQAQANVAAQRAVVEKLRHGSRPQEIGQARAQVAAAEAEAEIARNSYQRLTRLSETSGGSSIVSQSQIDNARSTVDATEARLAAAEQALELIRAGPRAEDVDQAEAQLKAGKAQVALLERQLADASLEAPVGGVVRSRLTEPGEIATPQRPVVSLAVVDPKWVRAYVSGSDLPEVAPGMKTRVKVDGVPRLLDGRIGFISPVAEFTPRAIQTEELRTSLVYQVRVIVDDPDGVLRLGMPATVHLPPNQVALGGDP